jgi:hypothetical protein
LLLWGALSDERTDLSFVRVIVKVKVALRLTVSQSVSRAPSRAHDHLFITV